MRFDIISLFADRLQPYLDASIIGRAQNEQHISIHHHDLRKWAINKHGQVDDTPYGGGPGMVIRIDVVHAALRSVYKRKNKKTRVILLSPRGETYDQRHAARLSKYHRIILIAGRYEAIDARIDEFVDEKISLGNFVMTGGELAAACIIDSVSRLLPGVLGDPESLQTESFSKITSKQVSVEYPHYTKPELYRSLRVPPVLISGNHSLIRDWREQHSKKKTR